LAAEAPAAALVAGGVGEEAHTALAAAVKDLGGWVVPRRRELGPGRASTAPALVVAALGEGSEDA
jgi:hypothetical protein